MSDRLTARRVSSEPGCLRLAWPRLAWPRLACLELACVGLVCSVLTSPAAAEAQYDPTRPPALARATASHRGTPVLSGIVTVAGRRNAIVDGQLVHVGSIVGPFTIESILSDGVRYRDAHGVRELHLASPSPVKKPAADPQRASGESHEP